MHAHGSVIKHTNRQLALQAAKQDNELDEARSLGRAYRPPPVHFPVIVSVANGTSFPVNLDTKDSIRETAFQMMDDGCTQIKASILLKSAYPKLRISQSIISRWVVEERKLQDPVAGMQVRQLDEQTSEDSTQSTSDCMQVDSNPSK